MIWSTIALAATRSSCNSPGEAKKTRICFFVSAIYHRELRPLKRSWAGIGLSTDLIPNSIRATKYKRARQFPHIFPRQPTRLLHPSELSFVEAGRPRGCRGSACLCSWTWPEGRTQQRAAEKATLMRFVKQWMPRHQPFSSWALDSIQRRIPFDGLSDTGAVRTTSASSRRPTSLFQLGMAAM